MDSLPRERYWGRDRGQRKTRTKLKCLWRNCTQNMDVPSPKPRGTRTEWTKVKGLELTHTSEAVLGKRKAGGASRIPWLLSPGSTCCISPDGSCHGAGECAHFPITAKGGAVPAVVSTLCPLVCVSPRSCVLYKAAQGPTLKVTAPRNCSIA